MATCKSTVEDLTDALHTQQDYSQLLSEQILSLEAKVARYSNRAHDAELLTLKLRAEKAALQAKLARAENELRNLQSRVSFK